jgi:hypothetical protein
MHLLEALRNSVKRLEADLDDSRLFDHCGDRGEFRERIIKSFLRPYLPKCYGLGSGAAFSSDGNGSKQLDVVIYDDIFSNVLFRDESNSLYPCESVYGVIEIKSKIDGSQLESAVQNIKSLKMLKRQPSSMLDLLPNRRLKVGNGLKFDPSIRNPYLGIIFAYDGMTADNIVSVLNQLVNSNDQDKLLLPNFLFNYRRGFAVMRVKREVHADKKEIQFVPVSPMESDFDRFVAIETMNDTLPLFFLTVNTCLTDILLKSPDLNLYWLHVFNSCLEKQPKFQY